MLVRAVPTPGREPRIIPARPHEVEPEPGAPSVSTQAAAAGFLGPALRGGLPRQALPLPSHIRQGCGLTVSSPAHRSHAVPHAVPLSAPAHCLAARQDPLRHRRALARSGNNTVLGVEARQIEVEVLQARGLPVLAIVGLPDGTIREGREHRGAAVTNSGFWFPCARSRPIRIYGVVSVQLTRPGRTENDGETL